MQYLTPLLPVLIEHALIPALFALGAWLITKAPGPLRDWLASGTHQRDMALLLGGLARKAMELHALGKLRSAGDAVPELVAYVRSAFPETTAKLDPSEAALRTMATAMAEQVIRGMLPAAAVADPVRGSAREGK